MKIAILDDDGYDLNLFSHYVKTVCPSATVDTYSSSTAFLKSDSFYSLLLLDIQLGLEDGIHLSSKLQNHCAFIAYVTSVCNRMQEAFHANVVGYLLKSDREEIILERLRQIIQTYCMHTLNIPVNGADISISIEKIYRISKENRKVFIYLFDNVTGPSYISLKSVPETLFPPLAFVSNSEIINLDHVTSMQKTKINFDNGTSTYVSRRKKEEVLHAFLRRKI